MNWTWDWFWFIIFCLTLFALIGCGSSQENKLKMIKSVLEDETNTSEGKVLALKQIVSEMIKS